MKRIFALVLVLAMGLGLTACGNSEGTASSKATSKATVSSSKATEQASSATESAALSSAEATSANATSVDNLPTYSARTYACAENTDKLHVTGRTMVTKDGLGNTGMIFDQTAQCLTFTADCEGDVELSLSMKPSTPDDKATHYFTVYIDGVRQAERLAVTGTENKETVLNVKIAKGLKQGEHTLALYRQTASIYGRETLLSVKLTGKVKTYDKKPYRIEFLGDSITVGYGNLVAKDFKDGDASGPAYSDGTQTYAFFAAEELGVEMQTVAVSGVVYMQHEKLKKTGIMDFFYNYSNSRDTKTAYDFKNNQVDMVVVSLGTNDDAWSAFDSVRLELGVKFLEKVRAVYPNAKIVWTYGQMSVNHGDMMKQTVEAAGGAAKGYYYYQYSQSDRDGGGSHPTVAGHKRMGKELATYLKTLIK